MAGMSGTEKLVLIGGLTAAVVAVVVSRHSSGSSAQGLTLREVNSPETEPVGVGTHVHRGYVRGYIDESPRNPNEQGGERVIPGHYGVQHQQASGLL